MSMVLRYLQGYPPTIVKQVEELIKRERLVSWFEQRYPNSHEIQSEKALYQYTIGIKERFLRKSAPVSKVIYDNKIHIINNALGLHTYVNKVHGSKIKTRNEIKIASLFKHGPKPLLNMIVVHELAHIKEKEHNKSFYQLCCHMLPEYHQLELDARIYMIYRELIQSSGMK
jgi:UTP pyrophosphatase